MRDMHVIKEVNQEDISKIMELYENFCGKEFSFPSPYLRISEAAVKNNVGELVAYGVLEVFAEALLILDKKKPLREKSESVAHLVQTAKNQARKLGIPSIYIFVHDKEWAEELKKHFGFSPCEGEALVMRP
jgi:N-acetylglutamate synthase-like GNAT family acetyltransferase